MGKLYDYGESTGKIKWKEMDRSILPVGLMPEMDREIHAEKRKALYDYLGENTLDQIGQTDAAELLYETKKTLTDFFDKETPAMEDTMTCYAMLSRLRAMMEELLEQERWGFVSMAKEQYEFVSNLYNDILNSLDDVSEHYNGIVRSTRLEYAKQELDDIIESLEDILEDNEAEKEQEEEFEEENEFEMEY